MLQRQMRARTCSSRSSPAKATEPTTLAAPWVNLARDFEYFLAVMRTIRGAACRGYSKFTRWLPCRHSASFLAASTTSIPPESSPIIPKWSSLEPPKVPRKTTRPRRFNLPGAFFCFGRCIGRPLTLAADSDPLKCRPVLGIAVLPEPQCLPCASAFHSFSPFIGRGRARSNRCRDIQQDARSWS